MKSKGDESQNLAGVTSGPLKTPEVESLVAGHELDVAVAERVMGYQRVPSLGNWAWRQKPDDLPHSVPHYSTDIAAAMQVLGTFQFPTWFTIERNRFYYDGKTDNGWRVIIEGPMRRGHFVGGSLPEAICRAALQATKTSEASASEPQP